MLYLKVIFDKWSTFSNSTATNLTKDTLKLYVQSVLQKMEYLLGENNNQLSKRNSERVSGSFFKY